MTSPARPRPPTADRRPVTTTTHGETRTDEYAWLRDRDDPAVLAHLQAENAHTDAVMEATKELQDTLFDEIRSRVLETDISVPVKRGPYEYFSRTEEGKQYAIHGRRLHGTTEGDSSEQILLDENALAAGHDYFALGTFELSLDHRLLAYAVDVDGSEEYELRVRDLTTGTDLDDLIEGTSPGVAWSSDATRLCYLTLNDSMRPWQLWLHTLGTSNTEDVLLHTEPDESFYLHVESSATDELITVTAGSQVTTEVRFVRADDPLAPLTLVEPRRHGIEYSIEHHRSPDGSERLLIVTNDGAEDFRLVSAPVDAPARSNWTEIGVPGADTPGAPALPATGAVVSADARYDGVKLDGVEVFRRHLVLAERADGMQRLRVIDLDDHGLPIATRRLEFDEAVHSLTPIANVEFDTTTLRFSYTSLVTPNTVYDEDLVTGERVLRKQQPVPGFDRTLYTSERIWATASDGARVPISLVRRNDRVTDGTTPLLLYGYGSYEISMDPQFSFIRPSILDRGWAVAIAHVRGGGERGRRWYLDGKLDNKANTFDDFIACAETLVSERYCSPATLVARGGSAGGLLMGAVLNRRPELFRAVVAEVPFVDVINTMLDDTLPVTVIEYDEWGNPNEPEAFATMCAYAPYENVARTAYPDVLATAGLNDPRVGYWEPAKWVARLRERATNQPTILLKTELGAGHGGPSGRYSEWRDEAFVIAFLLRSVAPPR